MRNLIIAATLVVAIGGGAAVAQGESPDSDQSVPQATSFAKAESQFSALRGTPTGAPKEWPATFMVDNEFGSDRTRSVAVDPPPGERRFGTWTIVPGTKGVCFMADAAGACATFEEIKARGATWVATPGKNPPGVSVKDPVSQQAWEVRGIVPDGVASVVASGPLPSGKGRGTTGTATVKDNAFFLDLPYGADSVSYRDARGEVVVEQNVGRRG